MCGSARSLTPTITWAGCPTLGGLLASCSVSELFLIFTALFYIPVSYRDMSHPEARVNHSSDLETWKRLLLFTHLPGYKYSSIMLVLVSTIANISTLFKVRGTVSTVNIHITPGFTLYGRALKPRLQIILNNSCSLMLAYNSL